MATQGRHSSRTSRRGHLAVPPPPTILFGDLEPVHVSALDYESSPTQLVGAAAAGLVAARARAGAGTSPSAAVAAAEAVSTARGTLYQCLIDLGWVPPSGVVAGMRLDERLVREGLGAGYDGVAAQPQLNGQGRAAS